MPGHRRCSSRRPDRSSWAIAGIGLLALLALLSLLTPPLLLACRSIDERFAVDPPERLRKAMGDPASFGGSLVALSGEVTQVESREGGVDLHVDALLETGAEPLPVLVSFDRPGTDVDEGVEVHVLGYAGKDSALRAVAVYLPDSTQGFYLREHRDEYMAWKTGARPDSRD